MRNWGLKTFYTTVLTFYLVPNIQWTIIIKLKWLNYCSTIKSTILYFHSALYFHNVCHFIPERFISGYYTDVNKVLRWMLKSILTINSVQILFIKYNLHKTLNQLQLIISVTCLNHCSNEETMKITCLYTYSVSERLVFGAGNVKAIQEQVHFQPILNCFYSCLNRVNIVDRRRMQLYFSCQKDSSACFFNFH